ncbi:2,5-diketo-D-gluconate reductase B [Catalinimonas alkaloidigena]|uniref:aldo/keto reductase n=1 Tax=Catalinimonas alkaloidigena TaxID=1075417 RepID=UPI0024051442|nr:aldo/keto reductase [Catalinimonas alkaloidigena]MDF9798745.1 2,5-diketo-D-gluconate reductase B [Catalinimonas alkaloidigena]
MKFINIKDSRMPALGFGTYTLKGKNCEEGVEDAIRLGYRHIDTAEMYDNETEVGKGIKVSGISREELFITTKVWYTHLHKDALINAAHQSLQKLALDFVDLLLIHWPNDSVALEESLQAMMQLQEEGKVKHIGVSNFNRKMVEEARKIAPVVCNQVEYHPYLDQSKLLDTVHENDMFLTAYCPIAKGKVMDDEQLRAIGEKYNKTAAQICLKWHMLQKGVAAVPRSGNHERRKLNLDIFDFELTAEEIDQICGKQGDKRLINPAWAPEWN